MGILTITVNNGDTTETNHKEPLKLITFMLYYAYYNTFEDPLNEHLYKRILNVPSEQSSMSFALSFLDMLKTMETQSKSIEEDKAKAIEDEQFKSLSEEEKKEKTAKLEQYKRNSEIIAKISDLLATNLEEDLFEELNNGEIIRASAQFQVKARYAIKTLANNTTSTNVTNGQNNNRTTTTLITPKYYEEQSELTKLLNQEKYMYIILALKTISLMLKDIIITYFIN